MTELLLIALNFITALIWFVAGRRYENKRMRRAADAYVLLAVQLGMLRQSAAAHQLSLRQTENEEVIQ